MSQRITAQNDSAASEKPASSGPSFAMLLVLLGAMTLALTTQIERPAFVDDDDPGPALVPVATAMVLIGGACLLFAQWVIGIGIGTVVRNARTPGRRAAAVFNQPSQRNVALVTVGLGLYVAAISIAGFALSTFLFSTAMMIRLGTRWWIAAIVTGFALVVVHLIFVVAFRVALPEGWVFDLLFKHKP